MCKRLELRHPAEEVIIQDGEAVIIAAVVVVTLGATIKDITGR